MTGRGQSGALDVVTDDVLQRAEDAVSPTCGLQVVEQHVQGKHPERGCEDVVVVTPSLVAVVDGVTSKDDRPWEHDGRLVTSGAWCARVLADALRVLDPSLPARLAVDVLSAVLREQADLQHREVPRPERPAASAVVLAVQRRELWSVGDCQWSVDGEVERRVKRVDALTSALRAAALEAVAAGAPAPAGADPGREVILPFLRLQGALAGTSGDFGYGQLDGMPVLDEHLDVVALPRSCEVVLASDGYPVLEPTLEASERALAQALADDPACTGPLLRGTKGLQAGADSYDDRAYVRVLLS